MPLDVVCNRNRNRKCKTAISSIKSPPPPKKNSKICLKKTFLEINLLPQLFQDKTMVSIVLSDSTVSTRLILVLPVVKN